ncbi:hypothetical protein RchiOBHm_Chr6g0251561 [Rosa chinensis]|uniref:Uncharacterized protein n=1 Tax=Rosa chinensis TaxID=74649 RepID=A0A2P6PKV0_ROSCH|nr:hypothetical protein RchiOBHm_Chr6g0251561 [Rosa chinensis]
MRDFKLPVKHVDFLDPTVEVNLNFFQSEPRGVVWWTSGLVWNLQF